MENIKVSVIMNCYNSDEFLNEAILSVLNQTYQNFELIFWDNQSTDQSAHILHSYQDERIRYFYADKFTSLGEARNLAISMATGEWIAFLDADDIWDSNKLTTCVTALKNHPNSDQVTMIYSKTKMIDNNGKNIGEYIKNDSGYIHDTLLSEGNFIVQSSIMVRLDTFKSVGGINPLLTYCPDYDLSLKVTNHNLTIGINDYLTSYRVHEGSITSTKIYNNSIEEIDFLIAYLKKNNQRWIVKMAVKKNIIYKTTSLFLKLIFKADSRALPIGKKYFFYLLFSPLIIHKMVLKTFTKNQA
jgi:glycosyltransferase involved in cell wall biosynthesis